MKLFLPSTVFVIAISAFAPFASGQTLYWTGGTNGEFNDSNNWNSVPPNVTSTSTSPASSNGIPGPFNIAIIDADINNGSAVSDLTFGVNNTPIDITLSSTTPGANVVQGLVISNYFEWNGSPTGPVSITNTSGTALTVSGLGSPNGDFVVDGVQTFTYTGNLAMNAGNAVIGDNSFNTLGAEPGSGTLILNTGTFTFDPKSSQSTQMILGYSLTGGANEFTFGSATGTVTQSANVTTTGNLLLLGYNGGVGNWNVTNGSTLQTGSQSGQTYVIELGANGGVDGATQLGSTGAVGTLTISDTSTFNLTGNADLQLGVVAAGAKGNLSGGLGVINQNGNSIVNITGAATVEIGDGGANTVFNGTTLLTYGGGTGIYNLNGGTLNISSSGAFFVGGFSATTALASGTFNQSGTSVLNDTGTGVFSVGSTTATGVYNFTGGSATFNNLGIGGSETFDGGKVLLNPAVMNQSGATTLVSTGETTIGASGTYDMAGTSATFTNPTAGATALTIDGTLNLISGTVSVPEDGLAGQGTGTITFGGGTLKLTGGTTTTFNYGFFGSPSVGTFASGTSTIDASTSGLTTFTFANGLGGSGGVILVGDAGVQPGGTVFNFASVAGGAPATNVNSYLGVTGIIGGTLNAFGEDIASSSGLIIGNGSTTGTLNLSLDQVTNTFAGTISGNGNLNINFISPGETFNLTSGGNAFSSGTITLGGASDNPGTLNVFSGSFGTINQGAGVPTGAAGSNVIVGGLKGSGTVNFGATGYTGSTTIFPNYTLNATNLVGDVTNSGTVNVATTIGGNVTNGTIDGTTQMVATTGYLTAPTIGTIGTTTLTNNAGSTVYTTTVNGTFNNNGTLGSTALLTQGALSGPGLPTVTINGPYTQGSTGTFFEDLAGTSHDLYQVNGAASLAGTITLTGATALGQQTFVVMNATGGVSGALNPNTTSALLTIVPNSILIAGDTVTLTSNQAAIAAFIAPFGATQGELATANAIDNAVDSSNNIHKFFNAIPPGPNAAPLMKQATRELSPALYQYSQQSAIDNSTFLVQRVAGICSNLRSGYNGLDTSAISVSAPGFDSGTGRSLGSLLAENDPGFHSAAPNGVNYYPGESGRSSPSPSEQESLAPAFDSSRQVMSDTPNPYLANVHPGGPDTPRMSEFIGGDVVLADLNQNQSANAPSGKASFTAGDLTAGVGFRITPHLAVGALFNYNHTDADIDSVGNTTKVDSYAPGIFATYFDHGFYANGLFSFAYNDYSTTHYEPTYGASPSATYSGENYVTNLDLGYDFHPDKNWVVGPVAGVTYTHVDIDSFTESGASAQQADQTIDSQSVDSVRSRLGGHAIYQTYTGDVLLQPDLSLVWQHEYIDNNYAIGSAFNEIASPHYSVPTIESGRDSALIGVGLTATLSNSLALYLNYFADVGSEDYFAQSVIGGVKARF